MFLVARVPELAGWDVVARLAIASGLGAAVGFEREIREREAGMRTHLLVSLGAALFTIVSAYGFHEFIGSDDSIVQMDPTRIAAQIVTGIGFIGAGVIMQARGSVTGLTTAATIFLVMAVGITVGDGYYGEAVLTTVLILFVLVLLRRVEAAVNAYRSRFHYTLKVQEPAVAHARLLGLLAREGLRLEDFSVEHADDGSHLIKFSVVTSLKGNSRLVEALPAVGSDLHTTTSDESD